MIERLRFPLGIPQFPLTLPPSCVLQGVEIENDISFLRVEHSEGQSLNSLRQPSPAWKKHVIRVYMEGEEMELLPAEFNDAGEETKPAQTVVIPIPADGATLHPGDRRVRLLGTVQTTGARATWHIFEVILNKPNQQNAPSIQS